jgi:hypothetical protein
MSNIVSIPYPDQFREQVRKRIINLLQPAPVSGRGGVGGGGGGRVGGGDEGGGGGGAARPPGPGAATKASKPLLPISRKVYLTGLFSTLRKIIS